MGKPVIDTHRGDSVFRRDRAGKVLAYRGGAAGDAAGANSSNARTSGRGRGVLTGGSLNDEGDDDEQLACLVQDKYAHLSPRRQRLIVERLRKGLWGYAVLFNPHYALEYYMQKNVIKLGRTTSVPHVDVPMGADPCISKQHATIYLATNGSGLYMKVSGASGIRVNDNYYEAGSRVRIPDKSTLKAGNFSCMINIAHIKEGEIPFAIPRLDPQKLNLAQAFPYEQRT